MTPPTRAETEGDIEFYLGHGDEGVRDLAVTALALLSENKRLTSLAKHERDNRGEQTKNKRVTHDVLTGTLRTAEARIKDYDRELEMALEGLSKALARIAALTELVGDVPLRHSQFCEAMTLNIHCDCGVSSWADRARALLSEPQDGEGGTPEPTRTTARNSASPWYTPPPRFVAPTSPPASHDEHCACLLCEPSCGLIPTEGALCGECRNERHLTTSPPAEPTPPKENDR